MAENIAENTVTLGRDGPSIVPMGIGTWAWGDSLFWEYEKGTYGDNEIRQAYQASLEAGLTLFDTAEIYGWGESERIVGRLVRESDQPVHIASKWFPYPWRIFARQSVPATLKDSLDRLGLERITLYQVHWPQHIAAIKTVMDGMADAVEAGLTEQIGVSNYDLYQTRRAQETLQMRGLSLASNQVQYSLLTRKPERSGLLDYCKSQGITLIAYSPLEQGMLTGKYTPDNPPSGPRRRLYGGSYLEKLQPVIVLMEEIGKRHGGKTPAQVALNWVICKGGVPIPGAKNEKQARDNAGALGWRLTTDEIDALDRATESF